MRRNLATEEKQSSEASSKRVKCDISDSNETLNEPIASVTECQPIPATGEQMGNTGDGEEQDKVETAVVFRRKCVAIFMCYNGFGFYGMQFNAGFKTIEGELLTALAKIGAIGEESKFLLAKMNFQRASKTDKGVSAVRQIVSLKMDTARDYLETLNAALPPQIRVMRILRTTQSFNCKHFCSSRFYQYLCPTFAFSPTYEQTYEGYRIDKRTVEELGDVLSLFKGTHNFHNYTSAVKANDPSCNRYIIDISTGETFIDSETNLELISINLNGQSFMLHQIRKMIGITIAIMKKYAEREIIERSFSLGSVETPKAPSLGLMLSRQEFKGYNRKFGDDGIHQPIVWDSVESEVIAFRDKYIYPHIIQQEAGEKTMFHWLGHLKKHNFTLDNITEATAGESKLEPSTETNVAAKERTTEPSVVEAAKAKLELEAETKTEKLLSVPLGESATLFREESPFECKANATVESSKVGEDNVTPDVVLSQEH